ncbi:sensor histidine kinase [Nonomuraea endophytica]|uniref:histidine kinase n=1 Tax=Nonomuraea endophytica TaxID=714136 RepID=A0A7W8EE72_9ACTN|nr:histidine kinase [Nonomuraea endophytica]MBB5076148.1 signal transduction histidine kinase [Nonomuraea endophytica]
MLRDARLWLELSLAALLAGLFVISGAAVSAPLGLAQIVPLAWRRRYPALVLVVVALATLVHLRLGMWRVVGYLPAMLALHAAAGSGSRSVRIWLCAAAALALSISDATLRGMVEGGLISLVSFTVVWVTGVERGQHARERAALAATAAEHARLRAESAERERLARRLHDTLAGTVTVMLVQTEALRHTAAFAPPERERVDRVLSAGRLALAEVRDAIADLDRRDAAGAELSAHLCRLRAAGLDVPAVPSMDLPPPLADVYHRLAGEAATNALRHGGPGARVEYLVEGRVLTIVSTPVRARRAGSGGGYGLRSLAADLQEYGGALAYGRDGERWVVTATFPE